MKHDPPPAPKRPAVVPLPLLLVPLLLALAACGTSSSDDPPTSRAGVAVSPDAVELVVGESAPLQAVVDGGSGDQSVSWSSEDRDVVEVDAAGRVTGVAAGGPVTVTATSAATGATGSAEVTVVSAACRDPEPLATVSAERTLAPLDHHFTCADYLVDGAIGVDAALTVEPGVVIAFADGASLRVNRDGSLRAVGTAARPIAFVGTEREPGHWEAIVIRSNDGANELRHVTLRDGGAGRSYGVSANTRAGLIVEREARIAIRDSVLRDNLRYGLALREGAVLSGFADNAFGGNGGAPVRLASNQIGFLDAATDYDGGTIEPNGEAYLHVEGSTTSDAQTWPAIDLPYRFHDFHYIDMADATDGVTLDAGATIEFASQAGLRVAEGSFRAIGTEDARITLTGAVRTDTGYWEAIVFLSNDPANELAYVDVAHGGAASSFSFSDDDPASVIVGGNGQLAVRHSTFAEGGEHGLYLRDGARLNAFHDNGFDANGGAPLYLHANQLGDLGAGNRFRGASGRANGAAYLHVATSATGWWDQTWRATDLPYRFAGRQLIDAAVTVAPGATLEFAAGAGLRTRDGSLSAVGTEEAPIVFTGAVATEGYWDGLVFASNDPANALEHVEIAYGGAGSSYSFSASIEAPVLVRSAAQATLRDAVVRDAPLCYDAHEDGTLHLEGDNAFVRCTVPD